jgi:hypothetical protein
MLGIQVCTTISSAITIFIKSGESGQLCLLPNFKSFIFSDESSHSTQLCIEFPASVLVDEWEKEGQLDGLA